MTFGIDIASPQRDIDLGRAKAEGVEFVVVKMGGLNVSPQYVAPYYRAQIDRAVTAGLPKGHYYLIGRGQTPEQQAEFFVNNLHRFDPARDILALDNEALDGNGTRWGDADAARFIRRVITLTGIPASRVWHYAGAADYRATGSWPELTALGVRFWWAAYGGYPTGRTPDHEPSLQGSIPRWDVHQYSSRVAVAGYALDGNYSRATVGELFGGGSMAYLGARPARGNITQGFGPRPLPTPTSPAIHYGQDYGWGGGDAIYAARGGTISSYGYVGSYGNRLVIDHGDGRQTWYCHLASAVATSGTVTAGQQVAWMGATGNVTGKHLHFELRINGVANDPEPYFAGASSAGLGMESIGDIMALKGSLEILKTSEGYFLTGPTTFYEIANQDGVDGAKKLEALNGKFGIPITECSVLEKNIARIVILGNQATADNAKYAASLVNAGLSEAQIDRLGEIIAAKIPASSGGATPAQIAAAVRDELRTNPLK